MNEFEKCNSLPISIQVTNRRLQDAGVTIDEDLDVSHKRQLVGEPLPEDVILHLTAKE